MKNQVHITGIYLKSLHYWNRELYKKGEWEISIMRKSISAALLNILVSNYFNPFLSSLTLIVLKIVEYLQSKFHHMIQNIDFSKSWNYNKTTFQLQKGTDKPCEWKNSVFIH